MLKAARPSAHTELELNLNSWLNRLVNVDIPEISGLRQYPRYSDFGYALNSELYFAKIRKKDLAAILKRDPAVVSRFIKGTQLPSEKQINLILAAMPNNRSRASLRRWYTTVIFDRPGPPKEHRNSPELRSLIAEGKHDGLYDELRSLRRYQTDPLARFSVDLVTFELCLLGSHFYRSTLAIQRMKEFETHNSDVYNLFAGTAKGLLFRHLDLYEQAIATLERAQATLTPGVFQNTNFMFGFSITPLIWHELVLSRLQFLRGREKSEWANQAALETYNRIDDDLSDFDIACLYTTLCHCLITLKSGDRLQEAIKLLHEYTDGYHPDVDSSWWYSMGNACRFRLIEAESSLIGGNLSDCLDKFSRLFDDATERRDIYHLSIAQRRFLEISRRALTEGVILPDTTFPEA